MIEEKKSTKKINWDIFIPRCPKCKSTSVESTGLRKRNWKSKVIGKRDDSRMIWEIIELKESKCNECNNYWWEE